MSETEGIVTATKARTPALRKGAKHGRRSENRHRTKSELALGSDSAQHSDETRFDRELGIALLSLALTIGGALRVWLSLHDDGIYWPDEIYQSLEPAHRLVFGYGMQAWEFIQGARNWAFPGLVAALLKLCAVIGLDQPREYVVAIRLVFSTASVATAYGAYRLARVYRCSTLSAACGAAFVALVAPAIYFAPRALSETASALAIVLGFGFALAPDAKRAKRVLGTSLVGLSVLFRLQSGIFALGLLGILAGRRKWKAAAESLAILVIWAFLFGLLDRLTWGGWFHSAIVYIRVNVIEGKAVQLGVSAGPPWYYMKYFWSATGGAAALLLCAFSFYACWRAPGLFLTAMAYLVLHSATPHKELRFLLPVLPIVCVLAAIGLDDIRRETADLSNGNLSLFQAVAGLVFLSALVSAASFRRLTFGDLGAYLTSKPRDSAYDDAGSANRLLLAASKQNDMCGIEVHTVNLAWSGGYSYLHRDVPLYQAWGPPIASGHFNYVIAYAAERLAGDVVAMDKDEVLIRLPQISCVPDPGYRATV